MKRLLVPANLLLAGEYAVTEEGHLGFALAIRRYVVATIEPAETLEVIGRLGHGRDHHYGGVHDGEELPHIAMRSICESFDLDPRSIRARIAVDSSAFYRDTGAKIGLGSSAAVVVALAHALTRVSRIDPPASRLAEAAVLAHREAQGGRGSGYDILASCYGGAGMVTGGATPEWVPGSADWCETIGLISNNTPVGTPGAVKAYEAWGQSNPVEHRKFLEDSDAAVSELYNATSFGDAKVALESARAVGRFLGHAIDVRADVPPTVAEVTAGRADLVCKALGAGDELLGCISDSNYYPEAAQIEQIDRKGARWV